MEVSTTTSPYLDAVHLHDSWHAITGYVWQHFDELAPRAEPGYDMGQGMLHGGSPLWRRGCGCNRIMHNHNNFVQNVNICTSVLIIPDFSPIELIHNCNLLHHLQSQWGFRIL